MEEQNNTNPEEVILPRALLIAVITPGRDEEKVDISLDELARLVDTAGAIAVLRAVQAREAPDKRTYIGKGKCEELAEVCKNENISLVVSDDELSPSQIMNLEDSIGVRVIDRTMLILDIFAMRATSGEGKLQVEIAQLRYTAPRLMGKGKDLSRLGGGIGTRGPGESQLERDRRHLKRRIESLQAQLSDLERTRAVKRTARDKNGMKTAAIVGYTNAGKSTLLNYLTGAGILAEDKLFATLDPTTRRLSLPDGQEILLTDTVGFIDRLPTHLVKAFRSTLDELKYADYILFLVDSGESDGEKRRKRAVTEKLIEELGAAGKPMLYLYNKADLECDAEFIPTDAIRISAKTGDGVPEMLARLNQLVNGGKKIFTLFFDHTQGGKLNQVYQVMRVIERSDAENGTLLKVECMPEEVERFRSFVQNA